MGDPFTQLRADSWTWVDLHPSGDWYFRGQAGIVPIIPKIGRPSYAPAPAEEEALFRAFLKAARPPTAVAVRNVWERLALAQHIMACRRASSIGAAALLLPHGLLFHRLRSVATADLGELQQDDRGFDIVGTGISGRSEGRFSEAMIRRRRRAGPKTTPFKS